MQINSEHIICFITRQNSSDVKASQEICGLAVSLHIEVIWNLHYFTLACYQHFIISLPVKYCNS